MSLQRRNIMSISCDAGCGACVDTQAEGHIAARLEAARCDWRYAEGTWLVHPDDRSTYKANRNGEQSVRGIDLCPNCEIPADGSRLPKTSHGQRKTPQQKR